MVLLSCPASPNRPIESDYDDPDRSEWIVVKVSIKVFAPYWEIQGGRCGEGERTPSGRNPPRPAPQLRIQVLRLTLDLPLRESRLDIYESSGRSNEHCLTKTLKAALNWLPEGGRDQLAHNIIICDDNQILWGVFDNLRTAVIETIYSTEKTPCVTPSPHHTRQGSVEKVAAKLPDPQTRSPDFMKGCIDRDDHRCVISVAVTEAKWVKNGEREGGLWGKLELVEGI
ncbi:unnamed protein product [Penicillium viridicatum]